MNLPAEHVSWLPIRRFAAIGAAMLAATLTSRSTEGAIDPIIAILGDAGMLTALNAAVILSGTLAMELAAFFGCLAALRQPLPGTRAWDLQSGLAAPLTTPEKHCDREKH